jgi:hypothetical protein
MWLCQAKIGLCEAKIGLRREGRSRGVGIRPSPQFNLPPLLLHRGIQVINVVVPSKDWVVPSKDWALEGREGSGSVHPAVPAVQPSVPRRCSHFVSYQNVQCARSCTSQRLVIQAERSASKETAKLRLTAESFSQVSPLPRALGVCHCLCLCRPSRPRKRAAAAAADGGRPMCCVTENGQ